MRRIILNTLISTSLLAVTGAGLAYAQDSALVTSGMGGGASSTARLTAQMAQEKTRNDATELCGNAGLVYGPSHGNIDGNGCILNMDMANGGNTSFSGPVGIAANAGTLDLIGTNHSYIQYFPDGSGAGRKAYIGFGAAASDNFNIYNETAGGLISFGTNGANRMVIEPAGDVGIGMSNPAHLLHVNGNGRFNNNLQVGGTLTTTGASTFNNAMTVNNSVTVSNNVTANAFFYSSDRNIKHDIRPIEGGLGLVEGLKPVYFTYNNDNSPSIGFIAQDVQEVVPVAVSETPNGTLAVDYAKLVAPLVAAVQEQQKQIQDLHDQVEELQARLESEE